MEILLPGLCAALILVGIHAYLGIHVIERGVIFVDLAMAQAAALGTMIGFMLYHQGPDHPATYLFSLGFTLLHAVLFTLGRAKSSRIPEEAVIGLTYAILSAVTVLLLDRAPHGTERIRDMLAGQVLWVSWATVLKTGLLYGAIGLIHFVWRRKFLLVSTDPDAAKKQGISVAFWDFLFYATFGIIITSSVAIGGVLLVFSLLVAPAVVGCLYGRGLKQRLLIGYGFGFAMTFAGFLLSYQLDAPTGATVVATFGVVLLPLGLLRFVRQPQGSQMARAALVGMVTLGGCGLFGLAWLVRPYVHKAHKTHPKASTKIPASPRTQAPGVTPRAVQPPRPTTTAQRPRSRPKERVVQNKARQLQALLKILEGHSDAPLLERQQAFATLCRLTKGALPACPFSGDLLQLDPWLKRRASLFRRALQKHTRNAEPPHAASPRPAPRPTPRPTSRPIVRPMAPPIVRPATRPSTAPALRVVPTPRRRP